MKRFKEQLMENPTLDAIGHDMSMSPKRKKQLEADKGVFDDFNVQQWLDYHPQPNSSDYVKRELKMLQTYEQYRQGAKLEFMDMVDTKVMQPYKDYFRKHELDEKLLEEVKILKKNLAPIVLQLKLHYNRPRPKKLADALQFMFQTNFVVHALKTAETPAYPSGHATEGRFISTYLADRVPFEHKGNIRRIGDDIGMSRQIGGVHYPSDTEFGHQLAGALYNHFKEKIGQPQGKLESFSSLTDSFLTELAGADLFKRDNKERFIKLVDDGELKDDNSNVLDVDKNLWPELKKQLQDAESWDDIPKTGKSWTNFKNTFGVALGKVGKGVNDLSGGKQGGKGPSGEDWEAMIVLGQKEEDGDDFDGTDEWKRIKPKGYWDDEFNRKSSIKLAKAFNTKGLNKLEQTGSGKKLKSAPITKEWKEWGATNATPKTDLKSGTKYVSLKKVGGSQVMSAKKEEGIATFKAAQMTMAEKSPKEAQDIVDFMKENTLDLSGSGYKGSIEDLEKELENAKGNPQKMKKLKPFQDELKSVRKNGKVLTKQMVSIFQKNPTYKRHFVFEAATGSVKFGDDSPSRANVMVEFDPDKGKITHNYSLKSVDDADVQKLSNLYKFYASFKSSGGSSPYMAVRGNVVDTPAKVLAHTKKILNMGESLEEGTHLTFKAIMNEALTMNEYGRKVLHENTIEQLDEFALLDKIKKGVGSVIKKVRDKFSQMWNWIKEKVSKAFDFIKTLGKNMLNGLFKFFGIEPTNVGLRGRGPELFTA